MILVFGHNGQVATELRRWPGVMALGRNRVDLSIPGAAALAIKTHKPRAVINAAAFTDVDGAEGHEDIAQQINGHALHDMAGACAAHHIPLVHLSSDYVFDGSGQRPWRGDDMPNPVNAYGRSKWMGEQAVQQAEGVHVILRTAWVFAAQGQNFRTTMQRLGRDRDQVSVVDDQWGGATPAHAVAQACMQIIQQLDRDPGKGGTYHFAGAPYVTWADFARCIFQSQNLTCQVTGIPSAQFPTPARRPHNSRLNCDSTQRVFAIDPPDWQAALREMAKGLTPSLMGAHLVN